LFIASNYALSPLRNLLADAVRWNENEEYTYITNSEHGPRREDESRSTTLEISRLL